MKRITLLLAAVLTAVVSMAQDTQVTVPGSATQETWYASFVMHYIDNNDQEAAEEISEPMTVAFDGTDVYFHLPNPITGNSWVKGTLTDGKAVFPRGQFIGTLQGSPAYLDALGENGLSDLTLTYNSEAGTFATDLFVLINSSLTQQQPWCYYTSFYVTKTQQGGTETTEEVVTPPAGLTTEDYTFSATSIVYNQDGSVDRLEPVSWIVKLGRDGNDIYVQGLFQGLPEAWVKGSLNDGLVTFAAGQYMGNVRSFGAYLCGQFMGELSSLQMEYNSGTLASEGYYIVINSQKETLAPWAVYAGATLTKFVETAATPATPQILQYQPFNLGEGYGMVAFNIPTVDTEGNALLQDKLAYKVVTEKGGVVADYVFTKALYVNLPAEELTVIPYLFTDEYDFQFSAQIFLNENFDELFDRFGIQSVYSGGGEEKWSDIAWYDLRSADGVSSVAARRQAAETCTDLMGRRVTADHKGLVIKTVTGADGTTRTVKVLRR